MKQLIVLSIVACLVSSCAVQRYGRLQSLTEVEKSELNCKQINLEIAKTEQFLNEVRQGRGDVKATHVLGFFADFGIGNYMEGGEAEASGEKRLHQLNDLSRSKKC